MVNIISLKNVNIKFKKDYYALYNISYNFEIGHNYFIMGESESGKSTLLRFIAGLENHYSGQIRFDEINVTQNADFKKYSIGFLPDKGVFFDNKTVLKNLEYAFKIRNGGIINYNFSTIIEKFELQEIQNTKLKKLSKMEKIKVALARLYLRKLDVLLIDDIFQDVTECELLNLSKLVKLLNFGVLIIASETLINLPNIDFTILRLNAGMID